MKEIKQILAILQSKHLQEEQTLAPINGEASFVLKLAESIMKSNNITDDEAATQIYGPMYDKHSFEILKSRLKQRALTSLLLYNIKQCDDNPREAMRHFLYRQYVEANLLLQFGARDVAIKMLKKIEKEASEYNLTDIYIQSMGILRTHYWFIKNTRAYNAITKQLTEQCELLAKEYRAEELYQLITLQVLTTKKQNDKMKHAVTSALSELKEKLEAVNSFLVYINILRLEILEAQLRNDHRTITMCCENGIAFLHNNSHLYSKSLHCYLLLTQCESLILLREYENILSPLDTLHSFLIQGNPNILTYEKLHFLVRLQTGEYAEAEDILQRIFELPQFSSLPKSYQDQWLMYKDYFTVTQIIEVQRQQQLNNLTPSRTTFIVARSSEHGNLKKETNEVKIPLLILEVICLLLTRNYEKLWNIDKSIDNYLYRHLSKYEEYSRSAIFLKMLRVIIKEEFHKEKIQLKTADSLKLLSEGPLSNCIEVSEIIPYDKLWKMIMDVI